MHRHPRTERIWTSCRWWLTPGVHVQRRHTVVHWEPVRQVARAAADPAMSLDDFTRFFIGIEL